MGDVAMLQVGARRLLKIFPDATLRTITIAPERLARYVGGEPVDPLQRMRWQSSRAIPLPIRRRWLTSGLRRKLDYAESRFQTRYPHLAATSIRILGGSDPETKCQTSEFVSEVEDCDLIVTTGGGFLTDSFLSHANNVLTTLELGQNLGKPTLVFGQGVGPLRCKKTARRAGQVLSKARFIGIREQNSSRSLLNHCSVPDDQIVCTGDDAIEMSYQNRSTETGSALGINLRISDYAGINEKQLEMLKRELNAFVESRSIESFAIPISFFSNEMDASKVSQLMQDVEGFSSECVDDCPVAICKQVSKCRLVVTGSYHAGVFALSQGIPVIALVASSYYQNKFLGLQDQFKCGCEIIDLSTANGRELNASLESLYDNADQYREPLLEAATQQIEASRGLYHRAVDAI